MKVLHLRDTNFFGGPEKQILEHAIEAKNSAIHIVVGSFVEEGGGRNELIERCSRNGIEVLTVPRNRYRYDRIVNQLSAFIIDNEVQILCTHGYKPAFVALLLKLRVPVPVIGFSRGRTSEGWKVAAYQRIEEFCFRRFDRLVAVSLSEKNRLKSRLEKYVSSIDCVPNSVRRPAAGRNLAEPREVPAIERPYRFVSAGRLSKEKGHGDLIDAMALLHRTEPNARLVICGDGPLRQALERKTAESDLTNIITFLGFRNDMDRIYNWMDIFVLPSLSEGLPNVVLEVMASGKHVVATKVGGVPELIDDGKCGFLADPGDATSLCNAMHRGLTAVINKGDEGVRAVERIEERYSFEGQFQKLSSIYRETA